ncbi:MAG: hypothetical protein GXP25_25280 [Planctomycetes bacterium]|nr:hypothetical protein [Planctomycetota bacterium]
MEDSVIDSDPIPFENASHADASPFERDHPDHDFILITKGQDLPGVDEVLGEGDCSLGLGSDDILWRSVRLEWPDGCAALLHTHVGEQPRRENRELLDRFELKRLDPGEEYFLTEGSLEFGILPCVYEESERTLDLVQHIAQVIDELQRAFGGVVADLKQFALYGRIWSDPTSPDYSEFLRFVNVHQELKRDGIWAHTHGMAHFGKPDIEVLGVPVESEQEYAVWLLQCCWHQVTEAELEVGNSVEDPFGRVCALESATEVADQKVGRHYRNDCLRAVITG